ncbi:hypothetical protein CHUAL_012521 [Chamberlinius hualienensis]
MKLLLVAISIILATVTGASYVEWKPKMRYTYNYYGHHYGTMVHIGNRISGLAVRGEFDILSLDNRQLILKISKLNHASLDADVYDPVDENHLGWKFTQIPKHLETSIQLPVRVVLTDNDITSIEVSKNDVEESVNIKKAILSALRLNTNVMSRTKSFLSSSEIKQSLLSVEHLKNVNVTRVYEDGINGLCETTYIVSSQPSAWQPQQSVLNVTKLINYNKCKKSPTWIRSSLVPNQCAQCEADLMQPLTTVHRIEYDIKRMDDELRVEEITSEAYTQLKPFAEKSDFLSANHSQLIKLLSVTPISTLKPIIPSPEFRKSLQYRFPTAKRAKQERSLKEAITPFINDDKFDAIFESLKELEKLMLSIVLEARYSDYKENITVFAYNVVYGIRRMSYGQVESFYHEAISEKPRPREEFDSKISYPIITKEDRVQTVSRLLAMSGNPPAILYLTFLIKTKALIGMNAIEALQAISSNIYEPVYELLSEILALAKHGTFEEDKHVKSAAFLTLGNLIKKACGNDSLPLPPYITDFCPLHVERILIRDIRTLLATAKSVEEKLLFIKVLGLTELPSAIPDLFPYASGATAGREIIQVAALKALKRIAKTAPLKVREIALTEFFDKNNPKTIRITALRTVLNTNPDYNVLQVIVTWLLKERSDDVAGYIFSYFKNMGNASHFCVNDLANNVRQLMSFIDEKLENGIQGSNYREWSQSFDDEGLSAQTEASWISSNSSLAPREFYLKSNVTVGGYSYQPFEFGYHIHGLQAVLNKLLGPVANFKNFSSLEDLFKPEEDEKLRHRSQINEMLKLVPRAEDPFLLSAFLKLGDNQEHSLFLDHKMVIDLIRKSLTAESRFNSSMHIHRQSLFVEFDMQMPSTIGVSQWIKIFQPMSWTLIGNWSVELVKGRQPRFSIIPDHIKVNIGLKTSLSTQKVIRFSTYNPFTKQATAVGVQTFSYINLPVTVGIDANILEGKLSSKFKPLLGGLITGVDDVRLYKYKVEPYSCQHELSSTIQSCLRPNLIHNNIQPVSGKVSFKNFTLGLPLTLTYESEHDWPDQGAFLSYLKEFESPFSFINNGWKFPQFALRKYDLFFVRQQLDYKDVNATLSWRYIPTQSEKNVLTSKSSSFGYWPILSGFARLPQRCESSSKSSAEVFQSYQPTPDGTKYQMYPIKIEEFTRNEVSQFELNLDVLVRGKSRSSFSSNFIAQRNFETLKDEISLTANWSNVPLFKSDEFQLCSSATVEYPKLPCDYDQLIKLETLHPALLKFFLSWGKECNRKPQITVEGKFEKSSEQNKIESEKQKWLFKDCLRDQEKGMEMNDACDELVKKLTAFNQISLAARYEHLPKCLQNISRIIDSWLKAKYYLHMSNNPVRVYNGEGRLRVKAFIYDNLPAFNLQVFKPNENTFFSKAPLPVSYVYPISAIETYYEQFIDEITKGMIPTTCGVTGDIVRTFDKNTLKMPLSSCHHVIVKDCSPNDLFAVTMKKTRTTKVMRVFVLNHLVEVSSITFGTGRYLIKFDNRIIKPSDTKVVNIKTKNPTVYDSIVAEFFLTGRQLRILLPLTGISITFDGMNAEIMVSQLWRGRFCGMCGEFRGDTLDDLVGPDNCLYPDPESFSISYGIKDLTCQLPKPLNNNKTCGNAIRQPGHEDYDLSASAPFFGLKGLVDKLFGNKNEERSNIKGRPCPKIYAPVCSSKNQTFGNGCLLQNAIDDHPGLQLQCSKECPCPPCPIPMIFAPVCGTNNFTYVNEYALNCDKKINKSLEIDCRRRCPCKRSDSETDNVEVDYNENNDENDRNEEEHTSYPRIRPCPKIYSPVCSTDTITFPNSCVLQREIDSNPLVGLQCSKKCPCPPCPIPAMYAPVCGTNNFTYVNQNALDCDKKFNKSLEIDCRRRCPCKRGETDYDGNIDDEVDNDNNDENKESEDELSSNIKWRPCPKIYAPVCSSKNQTFGNGCLLQNAIDDDPELGLQCSKECPCPPCPIPMIFAPVCGTNNFTYVNEYALNCDKEFNKSLEIDCRRRCPCKRGETDYGGNNDDEVDNDDNNDENQESEEETTSNMKWRPCPKIYAPVCSNKNQTYGNSCLLQSEMDDNPNLGLGCSQVCPCPICLTPLVINPVCGSNNFTYENKWLFECDQKINKSLEFAYWGKCKNSDNAKTLRTYGDRDDYGSDVTEDSVREEDDEVTEDSVSEEDGEEYNGGDHKLIVKPVYRPDDCFCTTEYKPVCATNGRTYGNPCLLRCELNINTEILLSCSRQCPCPTCKMEQILNPVCGSNNFTYINKGHLECDKKFNKSLSVACEKPCPCRQPR